MGEPRGIPSVTYVRVLQSGLGQGDVISDGGNALTILEPGAPSTRHDVAQVFDRTVSDQDVCELTIGNQAGAGLGAALNPVAAFVHDAATALITIIGSRQTKKSLFLKKTFLPFLANELFNVVGEKEHQQNLDFFQAQISFSAFEIQDEVVTDLLRPSSRGLSVSISAEEGVIIQGLHKEPIADEMALRRAMAEACDNRASHTLPPGASMETSSAVWQIELKQSESEINSGGQVRRCHSRLVVVDVPSVDPLTQGGSNLRQLESPTLHKSLLTFSDVVKRLSSPSRAALAPFRSSKLTHFLSEMLGGNAIVVALGVLSSGEPAVSRKTLEILGGLTSAVHFPVGGRELTEVLSGLLSKYRSLILQLQDEIINGAPLGEQVQDFTLTKIMQLQKDMATALLERNTAKEDRARIFEMMELLKAKYNTVASEKAAQSQQLIQLEEDKLSLARSLVELKLEHSQLQEKAERERFDLTSNLLTAKSDNFELDSQLLLAKTENISLKENNAEMEKIIKTNQEELAALNASLKEVRDNLKREEDKNVEMGTELLTLLNQKEALQARTNDLQRRLDEASVRLAVLTNHETEVDNNLEVLRAQLRASEEELTATKRQLGESELESRRLTLEMERISKDTQRASEEMNKEIEEERAKLQRQKEEMQAQFAQQLKDLTTKGVKVETIPLSEANAQRVRLERLLRDMEREKQRAVDDLAAAVKERQKIESDLSTLRETYRKKLSTTLSDNAETLSAQPPPGAPPSERRSSSVAVPETTQQSNADPDTALRDLMVSYGDREKRLRSDLEFANSRNAAQRAAFRLLYDKYRAALDAIDDNLPKLGNAVNKDALIEQKVMGEEALKEAAQLLDQADQQQKQEERQRLRNAEDDVIAEQQRSQAALDVYKKQLQKTETRLAASRKEVADLTAQVRQLIDSGGGGGGESREMMRLLQEQLKGNINNGGNNANAAQTAMMQKGALSLKPGEDPLIALQEAKEYIARLEENAPEAVRSQLRKVESKTIQLTARNSALEEELKSYQTYMRDTVMQYKKQAAVLRQQLGSVDPAVMGIEAATKESEGKLPIIGKKA